MRRTDRSVSPRPKKLVKKSAKVFGKATKRTDRNLNAKTVENNETEILRDTDDEETPETKKASLRERRRQGLARFVLDEADVGSDQDADDEDEENDVRRMEEEAERCSQDSFINDNAVLTQHFSQDHLDHDDSDAAPAPDGDAPEHHGDVRGQNPHRELDAKLERESLFRTPRFNRRMMRPPGSSPSSERGLGKMNFIRSVLEHHRRGGDCDQIEAEYQRLEATAAATEGPSPSETTAFPGRRPDETTAAAPVTASASANATANSNRNAGTDPIDLTTTMATTARSTPTTATPGTGASSGGRVTTGVGRAKPAGSGLTAEQLARIEANRRAALRRRAQFMAKKRAS